ncbi:MAG TPA: alpha-galactosidase [Herpetosiphonaceae bacterium]|nr:alpha-galactosidase [Herpetosiphonaceae bacterium]
MTDLVDRLVFPLLGGGTLNQPSLPAWAASSPQGPLFAVFSGSGVLTARTAGAVLQDVETSASDGKRTTHIRIDYAKDALEVTHHVTVYDGVSLFETWQTVRNTSAAPVEVIRLDSLVVDLAPAEYEMLSFTSGWGAEFESVRTPVRSDEVLRLETRRGRSSHDLHPWFALFRPDGSILSASIAWSGNWVFRFEGREDGVIRLSGGVNDWEFAHTLAPGAAIDSVPVVIALGSGGDLNTVSLQYARVGRRHWYPHNELATRLPVEWNHWWSYEDHQIDEQVFRANVDVAARLGVEVCTLDAGWFGPSETRTHWYDYRGDYFDVNTQRFPGGLRALSSYVHQRGMAFGLWCEIEALGRHARLAEQHPNFAATRAGRPLGLLCFGNAAVREWAFALLCHLVEAYLVDWIKLDFNLDPGPGCDRIDHGHGLFDGLYAHYRGYYDTLERFRAHHPEVVLENCSSGGLRIDLGMARRTLPTFLSDPDWPEHGLQVIWGASTMLAPSAWLHWGFSEWIGSHPRQTFNPRDPQITQHQLDYYVRIAMLGGFGLSQRLPELSPAVADRYAAHIRLYQTTVRRFVRDADFYRLTAQPRRDGQGERWAAFQYILPGAAEHLLAIFRLPGGESTRTLRLYGLESERVYTLTWLQGNRSERWRGVDLLEAGLHCDRLPEEGSALVLLA